MPDPPRGLGPLPGSAQPFLIRLHIGTIVVLTVLFTVLLVLHPPGSGGGVDFGLVFVLGPIMLLGLPWSYALDALGDALGVSGRTPVLSTLVLCGILGSAVVNLGLHLALYRWSRRRRGLPAPL